MENDQLDGGVAASWRPVSRSSVTNSSLLALDRQGKNGSTRAQRSTHGQQARNARVRLRQLVLPEDSSQRKGRDSTDSVDNGHQNAPAYRDGYGDVERRALQEFLRGGGSSIQ